MNIQIINRFSLSVIFELTCENNTVSKTVSEANLHGVNLREADLYEADLHGVNLREADLREANLYGAKTEKTTYGEATLSKGIKQFLGEYWPVFFFDAHIKIGCQLHSTVEWTNFTDIKIASMASGATDFWAKNKEIILAIAKLHQED